MPASSKSWCFTDNECLEDLWNIMESTYLCYGRETAPTTGQKHLQGVIVFATQKRLAAVKKLHPTCHWEAAHSVPASITYCKKEGDWFEFGTPPAQGKRNDLESVYALIKTGAKFAEVLDNHPVATIHYTQGIKQAIFAQIKHRPEQTPTVNWYFGATGAGKSHRAHAEAVNPYIFPNTGRFWEGYEGQTHVIFDDFRPDQVPFAKLLRILDKYNCTVEVKGASVPLAATHFWITAPESPQEMYTATNHTTGSTWEKENIQQLVRRCTVIERIIRDKHITNLIIEDPAGCPERGVTDIPPLKSQKKLDYPITDHMFLFDSSDEFNLC
ncbi:replication associated protein [Lake Sarah-associated circular molecule 7]|uniref:replication associated protein n=1 Tax=Lake Sarah-associated circular molecule 7 TaxID=1685732 RepID=UPI000777FEF7|nr:replication associated protein [Lake Sarah-associated circular molecule 7]ALE29548.1 replication associated protein [Lake Sarah-associated circular molecule 7]